MGLATTKITLTVAVFATFRQATEQARKGSKSEWYHSASTLNSQSGPIRFEIMTAKKPNPNLSFLFKNGRFLAIVSVNIVII